MSDPIRIGKYEIIQELGRGGFAVVYQARDTSLDRPVALKVLHPHWSSDPGVTSRFVREARLAARLRHPNIVTIHEAGEAGGHYFLAMAYLPGRSLRDLLAETGPLPLARALPLLEQLAHALDYAHGQGVIHRDVKPANIMLEESGDGVQATLTDFGLVKALAEGTALTSLGTVIGSPEYMAPEQADPNRAAEVGPASDRYALGIVAYEMLAGRVPFPGNTPATLNAHEHKPPPHPRELRPDLPENVAAALLKMLAKAPAERYPSAGAFVAALQQAYQASQQDQQRGAYLQALYEQLQTACQRQQWAEVLELGGQIKALNPAYRDVTDLMAAARRHMQAPPPVPAQPSKSGLPRWLWGVGAGLVILACLVGLGLRELSRFWPATRTRAADGMPMVYVPAGSFSMGSAGGQEDEKPSHRVTLDAFWLDQTEVTNAQYNRCVEAGRCQASAYANDTTWNGADYPVVGVSWQDATNYCHWAGGRLPTEAEWEYAARGPENHLYPWGNEFDPAKLNTTGKEDGFENTTPVGRYPAGASWVGALDLAGNVWEWVNDWYGRYPAAAQTNPTGPDSGASRVLRGGSWGDFGAAVRGAARGLNEPGNRYSDVGFRCVVSPGI